jgi:hypothetical protein
MTKTGRNRKIQERLNKATYPMIITGWENRKERMSCKQIGIMSARQMAIAAPLLRQRIKESIIRGTNTLV